MLAPALRRENSGPAVEDFSGDVLLVLQQNSQFLPPFGVGFLQLDSVSVVEGVNDVLARFGVPAIALIDDN